MLISDRRICQLHRQFLGQRGPTDVLTFRHGEIFISVETAKRHARAFANPLVRELQLYIVHGLLHLHGFHGELLEACNVDRDFSLTIANGNFRNCHSERSEESLTVAAGQMKSISQICFASLNMTLIFTPAVFVPIGSCA